MLLMLDNYDSFTYNLVQYFAELGADVQVYRNDAISVAEIARLKPNGIVLSPGPGRPDDGGIMLELIDELSGKVPMLGVCLGHQAIAQVFGGVIDYAPTLMHGKTSDIRHDGSVLFKGIANPFIATRYHSLVVDPKTLPREFKRTAWTDDGVIMAFENLKLALYGVQFHPESIMTIEGKKILSNFLERL